MGPKFSKLLNLPDVTRSGQDIANKISAQGSSKAIKQCKVKLRNLKNSYKKCKDKNKKKGNERSSCHYFDDFDQVLSSRNIVKMPEFCDVDAADK